MTRECVTPASQDEILGHRNSGDSDRKPLDRDDLFAQGVAALREQHLEEAIDLFRGAIAVRPGQPMYHFRLGAACQVGGRLDDAAVSFAQSIRLQPTFWPTYLSLALVQFARRQPTEGWYALGRCAAVGLVRLGRQLLRAPILSGIWIYYWIICGIRGRDAVTARVQERIARLLARQGDFDRAVASYRRALQHDPNFLDALNGLGELLRRARRYGEAVGTLEDAFALDPDNLETRVLLSRVLTSVDRGDEAMAMVQHVLARNPNACQGLAAMGWTLYNRGDAAAAIPYFEHATEVDARSADARLGLGQALRDMGRFAEANEQFERALDIDPGNGGALLGLRGKTEPGDPCFARLHRALSQSYLSVNERSNLQFAAGKMYQDIGAFEEAFEHYRLANDLIDLAFDPKAFAGEITAHIETFTPTLLEQGQQLGKESDLPVFIVGMPRSGTTLIEQILASHPNVFGAGELANVSRLATRLSSDVSGNDPYPECVARLEGKTVLPLAEEYLAELHRRAPEAARVTDKMPQNFLHLGLIALMLPSARVIHCRRDPMDTCLSIYSNHFLAHHAYAYDLAHLGLYYRQYDRVMAHWARVLPIQMLEVGYEDLVENQEEMSRKMIEFCGLAWDPRCLDFHNTTRPVHTASSYQVRQPLYKESIGRWRHYEKHLGPLKEALGSTVVPAG